MVSRKELEAKKLSSEMMLAAMRALYHLKCSVHL